jgi:hypothetical protein
MDQELNIKGGFIFSPIFEQEEDCQNSPFVFEKFDLVQKLPTDYKDIRKAGNLLKSKKNKKVSNKKLITSE